MKELKLLTLKILFVISISLFFIIAVYAVEESIENFKNKSFSTKTYTETIVLTEVERPDLDIKEIEIDRDLPLLPNNYDEIVNTFNLSLTHHQRVALLRYGQTVTESNNLKINEGYKELVEKKLPIYIPQQYITIYIEEVLRKLTGNINKYSLEGIDRADIYKDILLNTDNSEINYTNYLNSQYKLYREFSREPFYFEDGEIDADFVLDIKKDSFDEIFYRLRILSEIYSQSRTSKEQLERIYTMLNDMVIYSENPSDTNAKSRLSTSLIEIIYNRSLNTKENNNQYIYWKLTSINQKVYLQPIYIFNNYEINDNNFEESYDITPVEQKAGTVRIPILMYHIIDQVPEKGSKFIKGLYVTPEVFEQQLAYLVKNNYKTISTEELYTYLKEGINPSQKSVMLTFDDGTKDHYKTAFPLLKKYGLTGVFYIVSSRSLITDSQLREMADNGMIIDSHSATHINLERERNPSNLEREIISSRNSLRNRTGQPVHSIAYPGCVAGRDAFNYVSKAGYLIGTSCGKSIDHKYSQRLYLSRLHVSNSLQSIKEILSGILTIL
jgi:peptidoglycan/xylan/chitin deacetylase (PgdA/CDA1 family)